MAFRARLTAIIAPRYEPGDDRMIDSPQVKSRDLANKTHFDRWSSSYADGRMSRWFQYTQKLSTEVLDLQPRSKVLDVGCGTGFAVLYLASILPDGKACGIDISSGMIEKARAQVPDALCE